MSKCAVPLTETNLAVLAEQLHPPQPALPLFGQSVLFVVSVGQVEKTDTPRGPRNSVLLHYHLFWPFSNDFISFIKFW